MSNLNLIPLFLEANSKRELVEKMLRNNASKGREFSYYSPLKDGKKWVVWYYDRPQLDIRAEALDE